MKTLIATILILNSLCVLASSERFKQIKSKIERLENAIIKDFNLTIPSELREAYSIEKHALALQELQNQYGLQQVLLKNLEAEFHNIGKILTSEFSNGKLTSKEVDKLKNSLEYANRIILKSRKEEIHGIYSELLSSLTHKPSLMDLKEKLQHAEYQNCSIRDVRYNPNNLSLSFEINQLNSNGELISSTFDITQNDVDKGNLHSRVRPINSLGQFPEIITQFSALSEESSQFTLKQNESGAVTNAFFYQEKKSKPWFDFLGLTFGEEKVEQEINCQTRLPASVH